ncbi:hypothetical protein GCM10010342_37610 [Streptomyces anulatus]|nr:hypothetical protein GCM10010342_37610 [Streptomyces anulatus]
MRNDKATSFPSAAVRRLLLPARRYGNTALGRVAAAARDVPRRAGPVARARERLIELCAYPGYDRKNSGDHGGYAG